MITERMVRQAAASHGIRVKRYEGEYKLEPQEIAGTKRGEAMAYYTDCHEDAYLTIPRMRREFNSING